MNKRLAALIFVVTFVVSVIIERPDIVGNGKATVEKMTEDKPALIARKDFDEDAGRLTQKKDKVEKADEPNGLESPRAIDLDDSPIGHGSPEVYDSDPEKRKAEIKERDDMLRRYWAD